MKKETGMKLVSGLTGAAALLSGCAPAAAPEAAAPQAAPAVEQTAPEAAVESAVQVEAREQESFDKIANVQGSFYFEQDVLTPADEVFSLFGTAATHACAKPGFAFNEPDYENYYVNVGGAIKKSYSVSLKDLKEQRSKSMTMACSCATGTPVVNTRVTGVPVKDIIDMAELEEGVNTITMRDAEGYGLPLPLSYVLEKDALLVYKIGGQELPASQGAPLQVWMPDTVAKYFTRQVTEIELSAQEEEPQIQGMADEYRAKVSIVNRFTDAFKVGDSIRFEGYADDCGTAIAAVEFSMDGGETWTACETKGATASQWVYWHFETIAQQAGTFKLDVRARTEDGTVSPLASSLVFTVVETESEPL